MKSNSVNEDGKLSMDNSIINSSHELESVTTPLGQVALVKSENDKLNKPKLPSSDAFVKSELMMKFGPRLLKIVYSKD